MKKLKITKVFYYFVYLINYFIQRLLIHLKINTMYDAINYLQSYIWPHINCKMAHVAIWPPVPHP